MMLSPSIRLHEIFGRDLILNPRPPFANYGWLPTNPAELDFLTGAPLTIAGDLPIICNYSVVTEEVIRLLEKANLKVASFPHIYQTEKEYKTLLNKLKNQEKKLVFNHVHPPQVPHQAVYWIAPKILSELNNKANLHKFVPLRHLPQRKLLPIKEINMLSHEKMKMPVVIKAATAQSTGAGYDVVICRNLKDLESAYYYFQTCKAVVVEEFIDITKIFNIQFAKTIGGQIIYLGTSEQITSPSGAYLGNWLVKAKEAPKKVIELGRSIMERACATGFWGIAGFDIAISKDDIVLAIDLNFRLNGSTPALLLRDSIIKSHNAEVLLFRTWKPKLDWNRFIALCREFIESNYLVPISIYNCQSSPYSYSNPILSGLLAGSSKQDILQKEQLLAQQGLI